MELKMTENDFYGLFADGKIESGDKETSGKKKRI